MNSNLPSPNAVLGAAIAALVLAGCAAVPTEPDGAAALRARLTQLQADPQLAGRAPLAFEQANAAVTAAEQPQTDKIVTDHLEFMADRKISVAAAQAHSQWSVDQRKVITEQRAAMQLNERTHEADVATQRAAVARADADDQKQRADVARSATADAERNAADLQQQIADLQAKSTDRGLVLTLGDVLFATGTANLNSGGDSHLVKLAGFLNKYPDRTAQIEGHTDSVGSDDYNLGLSQRRAEAVKAYLVNQGIDAGRLTASGKGKSDPVGDNSSATGRQQNRRVEVIIGNALVSAR